MKKVVIGAFLILVLAVGISIEKEVCPNKNINSEASHNVTYAMINNESDLKLTNSFDRRSKDLILALFKGLVEKDNEGNIVPALAKEYNASEDGIEYTFYLRDDIYYSSGEKIVAEDYKKFLKSFLEDKENLYARDLDSIFGAEKFRKGEGPFEDVAISCGDDNTLVLRLNSPCYYLLDVLASPPLFLRDYSSLDNFKDNYLNIRYTGPFTIEDTKKDKLTLKKNEKYYNKDEVTDEVIDIAFYNGIEEPLARLESNNIMGNESYVDMLMDVPINEVTRFKEMDLMEEGNSNNRYYLIFNNDEEQISGKLDFRRAVGSVIDRERYAKNISKDALELAVNYGIDKDIQEVFSNKKSIEEGKSYLSNINSEEIKEDINFIYEKGTLNKQIAEEITVDLKEELDLTVNMIEYSKEEFKEALKNKKYNIALQGFEENYSYEGEYLNSLRKNSGLNIGEYNNPNFEEVMGRINAEINSETRKEIYKEGVEILKEDFISIPICNVKTSLARRKNIEGIEVTREGNIKLDKIKDISKKVL